MKDRYNFSEQRFGPRYRWTDDLHAQTIYGYVNDGLDTKKLEEAEGDFEKLFVDIRNMLTLQGSWCCDSHEDVLNASHALARHISKNMRFYNGSD